MNIIICLDDQNGMLFNNRRQSRDKKVLEDIRSLIQGNALLIRPYSEKLVQQADVPYTITENLLDEAQTNQYCFIEDIDVAPYLQKITSFIIYRWNRLYPADVYMNVDLVKEGYQLVETTEFVGSSHDKITKEIWRK